MIERTVIYAVHGAEKYFDEAVQSARSVRVYDTAARLVVYVRPGDAARLKDRGFDEVRTRGFAVRPDLRIDFQLKLLALTDAFAGPLLFLDSDTRVCGPLDAAWSLLQRFDVLACHAPWRRRLRYENYVVPDFISDVPDAFCELNTGVLFLANNRNTTSLLNAWRGLYEDAPGSGDQYLFMHALYKSSCQLYVLPPEYNFRYRVPQFASGPVRIVHGHGKEIEQALQALNQFISPRTSAFEDGALNMIVTKNRPPKQKPSGK